ncbi:Rieske (2Fe-2S) protein [Rothia mucilaginosa]
MPAPNGCCRSQKACASPTASAATASGAVESNAVDTAVDAVAATAEADSSARVFSRRATLITGAVASGALLASCAEGDSNVTAPEGTVEVGSASAVGVGKAARLTHGSTTVIVSQPSSGEYKAFSTVCTHQGCQVQVQDSNRIVCPCHGSEYAVADGSVVHGPAEEALTSYPVQVKGGKIFVTHTSKDS